MFKSTKILEKSRGFLVAPIKDITWSDYFWVKVDFYLFSWLVLLSLFWFCFCFFKDSWYQNKPLAIILASKLSIFRHFSKNT